MALLTFEGLRMAPLPASVSSYRRRAPSSCALPASSLPRALAAAAAAASSTLSAPLTPVLHVYCGRGDSKTKRGKRFKHSYGNARPRDKSKGRGPPRLFNPPAPRRKDKFEDDEVVEIEIDEDILS